MLTGYPGPPPGMGRRKALPAGGPDETLKRLKHPGCGGGKMADQLQLDAGGVLDARGAVWFGEEALLALADVQLGHAGGQRPPGQLLPLSAFDDFGMRLAELLADYRPLKTVVLGDLVPAGLDLLHLEHVLKTFVAPVACHGELVVVTGDPERRHEATKQRLGLSFEVRPSLALGRRCFVSGDDASSAEALSWLSGPGSGGQVVFGREQPVVTLPTGVASTARCRCFLVAPDRLLLPAYSAYSPGTTGSDVREGQFRSALAQGAAWSQVVAIVGQRLVSVPWNRIPSPAAG
jgi:metallophosphoesterase superfamily enzyme